MKALMTEEALEQRLQAWYAEHGYLVILASSAHEIGATVPGIDFLSYAANRIVAKSKWRIVGAATLAEKRAEFEAVTGRSFAYSPAYRYFYRIEAMD